MIRNLLFFRDVVSNRPLDVKTFKMMYHNSMYDTKKFGINSLTHSADGTQARRGGINNKYSINTSQISIDRFRSGQKF